MNKEYFIGIDIGTNTIGYAATDTHYNLIKKSSKSIWGIRLFMNFQQRQKEEFSEAIEEDYKEEKSV